MGLLNREAILGAADVKTTDVEVPEWGGTVRVRNMTTAEQEEFSRRANAGESSSTAAWLISRVAIDESGNPIFKPEDVAALDKKSPVATGRVVSAIIQVNRIDVETVDAAEKK